MQAREAALAELQAELVAVRVREEAARAELRQQQQQSAQASEAAQAQHSGVLASLLQQCEAADAALLVCVPVALCLHVSWQACVQTAV
jgi:hypothetical protein